LTLHQIINIVRENFLLAIVGVIVLGILACLGYFVVYKKILCGNKRPTKKQIFTACLFIGYIIMVFGVTFLNRSSHPQRAISLHFLSSYWEAWNRFSATSWQFVCLNIMMFIPLGILLPLLHKKFRNFVWMITAGFLLTLTIETLQLLTNRGSFVLDDMFNNIMGAIIGYGLIMGGLTLLNGTGRKFGKAVGYFSPLLIVTMIFTGIFVSHSLQEFGNLAVAPSFRQNMSDTQVNLDAELESQGGFHPVYQAPGFSRDSAREFVVNFLSSLNIDSTSLDIDDYSNSAIYQTGSSPLYRMMINFRDGSYTFTDCSSFNHSAVDVDEDTLLESLEQFGVDIPEGATFNRRETGSYEWIVDRETNGNQLIDGVISCRYYSDGTIKNINNRLVTYDRVRNVPLKSETEAYEELLKGRFRSWYPGDNIKTINIHEIELGYQLDSKGFYQPVYIFQSTVNGLESSIIIPAIIK